jgi:mannose/fructose/N-acetylgalactosamine-specific phosphotransferase system component IIB
MYWAITWIDEYDAKRIATFSDEREAKEFEREVYNTLMTRSVRLHALYMH